MEVFIKSDHKVKTFYFILKCAPLSDSDIKMIHWLQYTRLFRVWRSSNIYNLILLRALFIEMDLQRPKIWFILDLNMARSWYFPDCAVRWNYRECGVNFILFGRKNNGSFLTECWEKENTKEEEEERAAQQTKFEAKSRLQLTLLRLQMS